MPNILRVHMIIACITVCAFQASANWPTDTASPLVLGEVLGFGSEHVVASTPDGATWVAWVDHQCFPSLIVQRISAEGVSFAGGPLVLDTQDDCVSLSPRLEALVDNTVVVSAIGNDPLSNPVHRITANGQELWTPNVVADDVGGGVEALLSLPGGNALVASKNGTSIDVGQYDVNGLRVWIPHATFATGGGSNMRIFGLEMDQADGAYVLWDSPGPYTRRVYAMRLGSDGVPAWNNPTLMIDIPPGSSRHTDPVAINDGLGGLILVWTQGAEQGTTPVPIRMQRLLPNGTMLFDMSGSRISTATTRQFNVQVLQQTPGGDIYLAWRDGPFDDQEIRVQRMTITGERLWGDTGVSVAPIASSASSFSFNWLDTDTLGIAITNASISAETSSVNVHRVDAQGQIAPDAWSVSEAIAASTIATASLDDAMVVVWQRQGDSNLSEIVAQRINNDGTLGLVDTDVDGIVDAVDNCTTVANPNQIDTDADGIGNFCDPDFNNDCAVNFVDYAALTAAFLNTTSPLQDLNSDGVVNFIDISVFQQFFLLQPGPSGLLNDCDP